MRLITSLIAGLAFSTAWAQTGQALIANPLLSPEKMKEVRRQIMEAGHQELSQQRTPPTPPPMPVGSMPAMPGMAMPNEMAMPANPEAMRKSFASLRVLAIAGNTALVAMELASSGGGVATPAPMGGMGAMPMGLPGGMPSPQTGTAQQVQPATNVYQRRAVTLALRHGVVAYVDGVAVTPFIRGETVRLYLPSAGKDPVFVGSIQPAMYSPPAVTQTVVLEKPNTDYLNANRPDTTSMGQAPSTPAMGMTNGFQTNAQNQQLPMGNVITPQYSR